MKIVNLINFVRACEPRDPSRDLLGAARWTLNACREAELPVTELLQYDALLDERYVSMIAERDGMEEAGLWLEIVKPLTDACGVPWHGREGFAWDWHADPAFLIAYTEEQKKRLIDESMALFRKRFGHAARVVGAWLLDSASMAYLADAYHVQAFCVCREQWGTDGYTLWGGYYGGGYYPSRSNMFMPATTPGMQIGAPVFRMLSADPIHCYEEKADGRSELCTLEPGYGCGQSERWVDWYFRTLQAPCDLGFTYAQTGQENSFPLDWVQKGLPMQLQRLRALRDEGRLVMLTLGETGRRFRERFARTPATAICALDDWSDEGKQALWYSAPTYRAGLYCDGERVWLRDWQLFDERLRDPYLTNPCRQTWARYEALPLFDLMRYGKGLCFGKGELHGATGDGEALTATIVGEQGALTATFAPDAITVTGDAFALTLGDKPTDERAFASGGFTVLRDGARYGLRLEAGAMSGGVLRPANGVLRMKGVVQLDGRSD